MAGARVQPVVLALEDVHWADPTTLDVLRGIAERGALAPLFVLITARPEFRPPWGMRSHHGTISLAPLDRHQVRHMVGELAASHALPKEVVEGVTERTGGVPLFVEEVTRLLLERGEQGGIQAIPPTLQQSLTARLDRLGPAREVAQIGAVIGRDFSYALIRAVAGMEDAAAASGAGTARRGRHPAGAGPAAGYPTIASSTRSFRTRLMRICSRADVRSCTAASLRHCATMSPSPLRPSRNCWRITSPRRASTEAAIEWWGKAGQRSLERSALVEAVEQFTRALDQIATLPATPALRREQIKLQVALITPLIHVKGLCRTGNQGGSGAGASADRTS